MSKRKYCKVASVASDTNLTGKMMNYYTLECGARRVEKKYAFRNKANPIRTKFLCCPVDGK